jgi:NAD(P)-dependent dehydrogenase (short-subunit alcohol dehydrogenase family)
MTGEGKVALVTGGTQGIGFAAATRLAADGHRVAIASRSAANVEHARQELLSAGVPQDRLMAIEMDVGDEPSMRRGLDRVHQAWGDIEILVNNAGKNAAGDEFGGKNIAALRTTIEVNLFAVAFLCNEALPAMKRKGWGRIVNVASTAGLGAPLRLLPYSVSKAALIALTKSLAVDVADKGICVNAVAPGPIATANYRGAKGDSGVAARARSIPSGRLGTPEDVAEVIGFLASAGAAHVSGQIIAIDGGEYAAGLYSAMWAQAREK